MSESCNLVRNFSGVSFSQRIEHALFSCQFMVSVFWNWFTAPISATCVMNITEQQNTDLAEVQLNDVLVNVGSLDTKQSAILQLQPVNEN